MACAQVAYSFYAGPYGGSAIAEGDWPRHERHARARLDRLLALMDATPLCDDAEAMAVCAMAEELHNLDVAANAGGGAGLPSSVSVGSVRESYDPTFGGAVDLTPAGQDRALVRAAADYLHFYRGVG